jgi:hypothetical protein
MAFLECGHGVIEASITGVSLLFLVVVVAWNERRVERGIENLLLDPNGTIDYPLRPFCACRLTLKPNLYIWPSHFWGGNFDELFGAIGQFNLLDIDY